MKYNLTKTCKDCQNDDSFELTKIEAALPMKQPITIIYITLLAITIANVMSSCARQGAPTGGPRDSIPPTLVNMYPPIETTNFQEDELELVFDEFIQARTLKKDIIINPPIKNYDFKINKRTLTLTVNDTLQDSTTYTINFREAIKDVTEQNIAENVVIAFSTGPTIDSFAVQGNVNQLMAQLPAEDVIVGLYDVNDTLDIFNSGPMYLSKTDEEGNYEIKYIREGSYRIYAFKDESNNLQAESDKEPYGFRARPINFGQYEAPPGDSLTTTYQNVNLSIYGMDVRPVEILGSRPNGKYYEFRFNKYITQYDIAIKENFVSTAFQDSLPENILVYDPTTIYSNFQEEHKVVRIYNTFRQDSVKAIITAVDSIQQLIRDTVYIKFEETQRKPEPFTQTLEANNRNDNSSIKASITFSKPVIGINLDSIILKYDTLVTIPFSPEKDFTWNKYRDELTIDKIVDKDTLLEQVKNIFLTQDSIEAKKKITLEQSLLDSLKMANTLEDKLRLTRKLNQSLNDRTIQKILDSVATVESEAEQLNLLTQFADTTTVGTKIVINKREIPLAKGFNLTIGKGAFMSVELDSSKSMKQTFAHVNPEEFGTIKGTITTDHKSYTLQLLNEQYKVVGEIKNQTAYTFDFIEPGTYFIRVLVDVNENGKWDKGNILELQEPEPVLFYEKEIPLRAKWTLEGEDIAF